MNPVAPYKPALGTLQNITEQLIIEPYKFTSKSHYSDKVEPKFDLRILSPKLIHFPTLKHLKIFTYYCTAWEMYRLPIKFDTRLILKGGNGESAKI